MSKYLTIVFIALVLVTSIGNKRRERGTTTTPPAAKPLADLTTQQLSDYNEGKNLFNHKWTEVEGLGPFFNGQSCGECHGSEGNKPNLQGYSIDASLIEFGAPVLQPITIYNREPPPSTAFKQSLEKPETIGQAIEALGYKVAVKRSKSIQGMGLCESIPDTAILALQSNGGKATKVKDPITGLISVGKIGMKSQHATTMGFTAEALLRESSITNPWFTEEEAELNDPASLENNPNKNTNVDSKTVELITAFVRFSSSPSQTLSTSSSVANGWNIFNQIGCNVCHTRSFTTESDVLALDGITIYPYSDFLLHDMDYSGDGVSSVVDQSGNKIPGSWMRTAPLWGAKYNPKLWHDSSVNQSDWSGAINKHAGQGLDSKNKFNGLSPTKKNYLYSFLNAL